MSAIPGQGEASRWSVEKGIEQLLDRFEAELAAGKRPDIAAILSTVPAGDRETIFSELLALELAYRQRSGESPAATEYIRRFPDQKHLVGRVFAGRSQGQSATSRRSDRSAVPVAGSRMMKCVGGHKILVKGKAKPPSVCPVCAAAMVGAQPGETVSLPAAQQTQDEPGRVSRTVSYRSTGGSQASASGANAAPKQLGRFLLTQLLGEGAFGQVYRARDPRLDRDVAVKVPKAGVLETQNDVDRFFREARAAAQLRHPNIVPVYEASNEGATYYIVSGFVQGTTLREAMKDRPFDFQATATLMKALAIALHHAHMQGVIHRDLKPANVMLDQSGEPQVMDFGLARRTEGELLRTQEGSRLGTPAYMSPEQAAGESHLADARSDLWSLGVMLYELLTGKRPFDGDLTDVLFAIQQKEPDNPRQLQPAVPADLETICLKCLAKDPADRYESCQQLADELGRWLSGEPIHARPVGRVERAWRWSKRNPMLASLSAGSAVLAIVVVLVAAVAYHKVGRSELDILSSREEQQRQSALAQSAQKKNEQLEVELTEQQRNAEAIRIAGEQAKSTLVAEAEKEKQLRISTVQLASLETRRAERARTLLKYCEKITEAQQAIQAGQLDAAREQIEACNQNEHSAWELAYLLHQSEKVSFRFRAPNLNGRSFTGRDLKGRQFSDAHSLVVSPDSRTLASLDPHNNSLLLWDLETGRRLKRIDEVVKAAAFSPDGSTLGVCCENSALTTVQLFDTRGEKKAEPVSGVPATFWDFHPAFDSIVLGREENKEKDPVIAVFNMQTGDRTALLTGPLESFIGAAWSPDGKRLAIAAGGPNAGKSRNVGAGFEKIFEGVRIVSADNQAEPVSSLAGPMFTVAWSPDGKYIASIGFGVRRQFIVRVIETQAGAQVFESQPLVKPLLAWCPDSRRLAIASTGKLLQVWDITENKLVFSIDGDEKVAAMAWNPAGTLLATGSSSNQLKLWHGQTGSETAVVGEHKAPINCVTWSPDGRTIISCDNSERILLWHKSGGDMLLREHGPVNALAQSNDGSIIASLTARGIIRLWDARSGRELRKIEIEPADRTLMAFDRSRLITVSGDGPVRIWNCATGELDQTIDARQVLALACSSARQLVTAHADHSLRIWELDTGKELRTVVRDAGPVQSICLDPNASRIFCGRTDGAIDVWDAAAGELFQNCSGHSATIEQLEVSRDGRWLASRDDQGTVLAWDLSGDITRPAWSRPANARSIALSPDSKRVAIARSNALELMDVETGSEVISLNGHRVQIHCVIFGESGEQLVSADLSGQIRIRSAAKGEQSQEAKEHSPGAEE